MIQAYINYPNSHVSIHGDLSCGHIMQARKKNQRKIKITTDNKLKVMWRFHNNEFKFGSTQEFNDMWLSVDLGDINAEQTMVEEVRMALSRHYKPFAKAEVIDHC